MKRNNYFCPEDYRLQELIDDKTTATVSVTVNFGRRHVDVFHFTRRNRLRSRYSFRTFSDVVKEPRGVITRAFFFYSDDWMHLLKDSCQV